MRVVKKESQYSIRNGLATWIVPQLLDIAAAEDLHRVACELFKDERVKKASLKLPDGLGVPLPAYQILYALQRDLNSSGRPCEVMGNLEPSTSRNW